MSITFWCPAEPEMVRETYECDCDEEYRPRCPHCQGAGVVVFKGQEHEVNMANDNALAMLRLIAPEAVQEDYYGEFTKEQLPQIIRAIIRALNQHGVQRREVQMPTVEEGNGQCTIYYAGRDRAYITERLSQLLDLFHVAQQLQSKVVWG